MKLNEIRVGQIYKTVLRVQIRSEKEIREVEFFVRVIGTQSRFIEFVFLNSVNNEINYLRAD